MGMGIGERKEGTRERHEDRTKGKGARENIMKKVKGKKQKSIKAEN